MDWFLYDNASVMKELTYIITTYELVFNIQRIYWRKAFEKSKESPVNNNLNARSNQQEWFLIKK